MKEVLGLGIVGYGKFGEISAEQYAKLPQIEIIGAVDNDSDRREAAACRFNIPTYTDMAELLADPRLDIVVLNTPPWLHGIQAIQAAQARKHLFVEKPLATSMSDARRIESLVARYDLKVGIDYVMRHVSLYEMLRKVTTSSIFGKMVYFALENDASNEALHAGHWFWDHSKSGGIFVEHGVHFFDLCNSLIASQPTRVTGFGSKSDGIRQDRVLATVQYENGALATFSHCFDRPAILERTSLRVSFERALFTFRGWIPEEWEMEGTLPRAHCDELASLLPVSLEMVDNASHSPNVVVKARMHICDRTAEYASAIRSGMEDLVCSIREPHFMPRVTLQDGIISLAVALAAQTSIDTGKGWETVLYGKRI
jgi:predicted dehydrogenase